MSNPMSSMSHSVAGRLLSGVAGLAIAISMQPAPAAAQSFLGTPTVATGGATVNTSPGNTIVNVNAPVTVINWAPDDTTGTGIIQFQPAGTTALFRSINFQDFTVLNRILPVDVNGGPVVSRPVRFDGTVNSQFGFSAVSAAGSIWFYTPGGIILGSGSAFNVGSLVLSTSDINQSNVFVGNSGTINFTGTPNVNSAITIENGAQVNALIDGSSYVAMVAPRIVQNGNIQVDGSAAFVGAEAVDITMSGASGLFDIAVTTGTSDPNGIVHGSTGTTTGPASGGAGDPQRIYMMAIPRNTAISMLVNGSIGYTPAATATIQNGEVILSAGYDIAGGAPDLGEHAAPVNNVRADMVIGETSTLSTGFSSAVFARASGNLRASPGIAVNGPSFLLFSSSAFLLGDLSSIVETNGTSESVGVGGDLFISSRRGGQGGNAAVRALGGLIAVGGDLTVDATSVGFSGQSSGVNLSNIVGGNGRGGNASLVATDGGLRISGATQVIAQGVGGYGTDIAGNGTGGTASVSLSGVNSQVQLDGGLDVQAGGFGILSFLSFFGANLTPPEGVPGGNGLGGAANVTIDDVASLILPSLFINAAGSGDSGGTFGDGGGAGGGNGTGGIASLSVNNEALVLSDLTVDASGFGGDGGRSDDPNAAAGNGGSGTGGSAQILLSGLSSLNPSASASGGMAAVATGNGGGGGAMIAGSTLDSGSGGAGQGGTANIAITGGSQVDVFAMSAFADARTGGVGNSGANFGGTGVAQGGIASILIDTTGAVDAPLLTASASTSTSQTSRTGDAIGGSASIAILNGLVTSDNIVVSADTVIDTENGQNVGSANAMFSGDGTGGNASLSIGGGSLTANNATITANGQAMGQNPDGSATIDASSAIERQLAGGDGRGGSATFNISGGAATIAVSVLVEASGTGGAGFINSGAFATQPATAGGGGVGIGGDTSFDITGGSLTAPVVDLRADGIGGAGGAFWELNAGDAGNGGAGRGGTTEFSASGNNFAIDALALSAIGTGGVGGVSAEPIIVGQLLGYGSGAAAGGSGGQGNGGRALVAIDFDQALPGLSIDASGFGGDGGLGLTGGVGGSGFGGANAGSGATLDLTSGDFSVDTLVLVSDGAGGIGGNGTGGPGGAGGNATGGDAAVRVRNAGSNLTSIDMLVQADATGGNAGTSNGLPGGAAGGSANGGNAGVSAVTGSIAASNAAITANARGNSSAASRGGNAAITATGGNISFGATTASADGETGIGTGGTVIILANANASSGQLTLGDTVLSSDGTTGPGGTVRIDNDNGNPVGAAIQFSQLFASADGTGSSNPSSGMFVRANQSDVVVTGNASLFARNILRIDALGEGTFATGGRLDAVAGSDILISHSNQPGLVDTVRAGQVSLVASRNFDAQSGSILRAADFIDVQAGTGFANVDQLFAANTSTIAAGTDLTLRNAAVTGGSLNLAAGRIFANAPTFRRATATIQGLMNVSDGLLVNSGGDVVLNGGADVRAGNGVVLNAGDDIIIRNSAINSAQNVTTSGEIDLNVGAITPVDAVAGEIRSLVIANSNLTSTGYDLNLAADAIDAATGVISANRLVALVNNPPAPGVAGGNDGGLLSANCVQGNICLGAISTPTQILAGPATGTSGLANRVTLSGSLSSNNITIRARDGMAFNGPVSVTAANNLLISVLNGPVDLTGAATLRGGNSASLYAGAGAINAPGTALVSGGNVGLFGSGGISLGSVDAGGVLNTVNNDGTVATTGSLVTPGNVTIAGQLAVRGGAASIDSGGAIFTGSILTTNGNDVVLTSTGAQSVGSVSSGRDFIVNAAALAASSITAQRNVNAVVSGSAAMGSITAVTAINVRANVAASFSGTASAPNISVASGDIAIAPAGQIGVIGTTQNVALTNSAAAPMTIGGNGVAAGYSLSANEIARIFADDINIAWSANLATTSAPVSAPTGGFAQPGVVVDALTLTSRAANQTGNLAGNGSFAITTPGVMQVTGIVALDGAGTGNSIRLDAGQSLQIVAGQGAIAVRDATTGLAGSIDLTSLEIIAASPAATTEIAALTDAAAISTRLGRNDGNLNDTGLLSADRVNLNGGTRVLVQNSGAGTRFDDRRGITANAITINVTDTNGLVAINGRITTATGLAAIPLLSINGTPSQTAAGFNALSTMNGCQITAAAACIQRDENPVSVTDDDINGPLDPDQPGSDELPTALIQMKEFETFGYPPLIDEPVTGSGNDDLWPATCNPGDESCTTQPTPAP
jgi:hypothetical protein